MTIGVFPEKVIESERSWKKGSDLGRVVYVFSDAAQREVRDYVRRAPEGPLTFRDIQNVEYDSHNLPSFVDN